MVNEIFKNISGNFMKVKYIIYPYWIKSFFNFIWIYESFILLDSTLCLKIL